MHFGQRFCEKYEKTYALQAQTENYAYLQFIKTPITWEGNYTKLCIQP